MRLVLLVFTMITAMGCGSSSQDEEQAAKQLAPKPLTSAQKAQLERFKGQGGTPAAPGH